MNNDFILISPSYKRSNIATTHKAISKNIYYAIRESEYNLYKNIHDKLIVIPDNLVSNISNTRNWILDNVESTNIVMLDDDYKNIYFNSKRIPIALNEIGILNQIYNGFNMSYDSGLCLFGLNVNTDPLCYRVSTPFSFSQVVLGPFQGVIKTNLRYDEALPLKEDYDFFLQNMKDFRRVLRMNFLSYDVNHQTLSGGCQTYRTKEAEIEQNKMLQKKWGSKIVQENTNTKGSINMIVRSPIK